MSKRLQVLFDEHELEEIQRAAEEQGVTVSDWVRSAVREARKQGPSRSKESKLAAIRKAATFSFPTGSIEQMLEEIELGRTSEP